MIGSPCTCCGYTEAVDDSGLCQRCKTHPQLNLKPLPEVKRPEGILNNLAPATIVESCESTHVFERGVDAAGYLDIKTEKVICSYPKGHELPHRGTISWDS